MIQRSVNAPKYKSFFLFGARGTGKSRLLARDFSESETLFLDLPDVDLADRLLNDPGGLNAILDAEVGKKKWVVIDEVQKIWLCEIKSSSRVDERHTHGVAEVAEVAVRLKNSRAFVISNDSQKKSINGVECMHWQEWFSLFDT